MDYIEEIIKTKNVTLKDHWELGIIQCNTFCGICYVTKLCPPPFCLKCS